MKVEQHQEMETVIRELRDFSRVSLHLVDKIAQIKAKIVEWDNQRENAEMLARQAQNELEGARAEMQIQMNRLPHELAPLRNKILEQERSAAVMFADAQAARQEAQNAREKADALLAQAQRLTGSVAVEEKKEPKKVK